MPSANKLLNYLFSLWRIHDVALLLAEQRACPSCTWHYIELLWCTIADFVVTRHVATELIRPKSGGLCHLVCYSATCIWDQNSWHRWAATASTVCVVQLAAVADWWCSWPMPNTLACLCSCQRRTFWTCLVTINLFSLYSTSFLFHTMLYAAGDVLRAH